MCKLNYFQFTQQQRLTRSSHTYMVNIQIHNNIFYDFNGKNTYNLPLFSSPFLSCVGHVLYPSALSYGDLCSNLSISFNFVSGKSTQRKKKKTDKEIVTLYQRDIMCCSKFSKKGHCELKGKFFNGFFSYICV